MRTHRLMSHVRSSLWFVPVVCVLAGAALSFTTIWIETAFDNELVPEWLTGGPDAALAILSTVATVILVLVTLFCALPLYPRVARERPQGEGSIAIHLVHDYLRGV